jgi:hypothetical protein
MAEKATFRLPEWEMEKMRELSRRQRRPLNTVAADVIAAGLQQAAASPDAVPLDVALGRLLVRPATRPWTGATWGPSPVQLTDALDWARGDR